MIYSHRLVKNYNYQFFIKSISFFVITSPSISIISFCSFHKNIFYPAIMPFFEIKLQCKSFFFISNILIFNYSL